MQRWNKDETASDKIRGGKKNGRGAYICPNMDCFLAAKKTKGLERSLKMAIPEEIYEELQKEMQNIETR